MPRRSGARPPAPPQGGAAGRVRRAAACGPSRCGRRVVPAARRTSPLVAVRSMLDVRPAEDLNAGGVPTPLACPHPAGRARRWPGRQTGGRSSSSGRRGGVQQLYVRRLGRGRGAAARRAPKERRCRRFPRTGSGWPSGRAGRSRRCRWRGARRWTSRPASAIPHAVSSGTRAGLVFFERRAAASGRSPPRREAEGDHDGRGSGRSRTRLPSLLPGGRVLLYTVRKRSWTWGDEEIVAQALATGDRKRLLTDAADARYVPRPAIWCSCAGAPVRRAVRCRAAGGLAARRRRCSTASRRR